MNRHHRELITLLEKNASRTKLGFDVAKYLGSGSVYLNISTADRRRVVKKWIGAHKDLSRGEWLALLNSLARGKTFQEKGAMSDIIVAFPDHRATLDPSAVESWLDHLSGWGEVDSLCQSAFGAADMLARWNEWRMVLRRLARDGNINKRRAALVLLTKPVRESGDGKLQEVAFGTISRLKAEKHILITKAVSWLLRSLIVHHRASVAAYLAAHERSLPSIAFREARSKLLTGKKYVRRSATSEAV